MQSLLCFLGVVLVSWIPLVSTVDGLGLNQYTPTNPQIEGMTKKALEVNSGHDPDGVTWIPQSKWEAAKWDGTIYNPFKMSKKEFAKAICPDGDTIRGLRELFYSVNPFQDNENPTIAEIDNWHRIALNHVRRLVGYTSSDRQVQNDYCMSARAYWIQQRQHTTIWDTKYPGKPGSAYGPCVGGPKNSHCGATFVPDATDQIPFLPAGHSACKAAGGSAEGIFPVPKSDIPWSIKFSRALCYTIGKEGFKGGHTGPFFHRQKFGFSFWDSKPDFSGNAVLLAKWHGKLMPAEEPTLTTDPYFGTYPPLYGIFDGTYNETYSSLNGTGRGVSVALWTMIVTLVVIPVDVLFSVN